MSTPYTLMRCRMKDLISCFNACKLPIEELDADESNQQESKASSTGDNCKHVRDENVKIGTTLEKAGGGEESPASWQSCESEEDDYIVFYFKDGDADGDVIEERSLQSSSEKEQNFAGGNRRKIDSKSVNLKTEELNESGELRDPLGDSSDSSTSSFAFPTIQNEWTGSPVLMPRPGGYKKSGGVWIQCCKF